MKVHKCPKKRTQIEPNFKPPARPVWPFSSSRGANLPGFIQVNPKTEVGTMGFIKCHCFQMVEKVTPGIFVPSGCRRGAHGVTRPTTMDLQRCFSIPRSTSEFGVNPTFEIRERGCRLKVTGFRVGAKTGRNQAKSK